MASSKDFLQTSRPPLNHRSPPSTFNPLSGISGVRQPHSRTNSHTTMTARPLTQEHRVRRKSLINNGTNVAAVAAAASRADVDKVPALPMAIGLRRASKSGGLRPDLASLGNMPSQAASVPVEKYTASLRGASGPRDDAVDDQEDMLPEESESLQTGRDRRASDGQPLTKEGRKFNRPIITCPHPGCFKQYKHNSCLEKHKWEHTPEWAQTSRLLISKHQQVQMLEAAKILIALPAQSSTPPESTFEPSSPSLSGGFSEQMDGQSSARTTPPPQMDGYSDMHMDMDEATFSMASDDEDDAGGAFSRQFRNDNAFGSLNSRRWLEPSPTPAPASGDIDEPMARAVALLSCSYNSNGGSLTGQFSHDIPPMPPVPVQFLDQVSLGQSPFLNSFPNPSQAPESFTRGESFTSGGTFTRSATRRNVDTRMEEDDDDDDSRSRSRCDEEEDGFFGEMEV
ncbi:unnamed protein product [Discula destructiva]